MLLAVLAPSTVGSFAVRQGNSAFIPSPLYCFASLCYAIALSDASPASVECPLYFPVLQQAVTTLTLTSCVMRTHRQRSCSCHCCGFILVCEVITLCNRSIPIK